MAPLRGWCTRGTRLRDHVHHGHWKTQTFLAALRHDQVTAPCLLDGPVNAQSFLVYVEQFLLPTLERGNIVVMDISAHIKGKECATPSDRPARIASFCRPTRQIPALRGDKPHSIEQVFSKLKALLRKARARTFNAVSDSIGDLLNNLDNIVRFAQTLERTARTRYADPPPFTV
jgi:transposase